MSQCLYITFNLEASRTFLHDVVQKKARSLSIEGMVQAINGNNTYRIVACGSKDALEGFLEELHKEAARESISNIEVEPLIKDKDYRGIFRVVE